MKKIYTLLLFGFTAFISNGQGTWVHKANFSGTPRWGAVSFSIGTKAYVGLGNDNNNKNDFWAWDEGTNGWSAIAPFPGDARFQAVAFSIGNKGYVGTGASGLNFPYTPYYSDFWEYNPASNQWNQIASLPGAARFGGCSFSVGNKGYVGTGLDSLGSFLSDFWEYDPALNQWTQRSSLPATNRMDAVGFSIGTKGYIGTGGNYSSNIVLLNDLWQYNPDNDQWIQKADFAGTNRSNAVGFSAAGKGYIGQGGNYLSPAYSDFWEYDTLSNQWNQVTAFTTTGRWLTTGFSVGNKGYVSTGASSTVLYKDLWEFNPSITGGTEISANGITLSHYPNPVADKIIIQCHLKQAGIVEIEIRNAMGQIVAAVNEGNRSPGVFSVNLDCSQLSNGIYYYTLKTGADAYTNKMVVCR